jgi:hypothetical protein
MPKREETPAPRSTHGRGDAPSRTGKPEAKQKKLSGWAALKKEKAEADERKKVFDERKDLLPDFYLTDTSNTAQIQFLDDEPICFDAHKITLDGRWATVPCQLSTQRHCLMCREDIKQVAQFGFRVMDYRGNYGKKGFTYDEPVEKFWIVGTGIGDQLQQFSERKKKDLTEMVVQVTKSGTKKSTSYNFEYAEDDEGERLTPNKRLKSKYKSLEDYLEVLVPSDTYLDTVGFEAPEYNN